MRKFFLLLTLVSLTLFTSKTTINAAKKPFTVSTADLIATNLIQLKCSGLTNEYSKIKFEITPKIKISGLTRKGPYLEIETSEDFIEGEIYTLSYSKKDQIGINTTFLVEQRFNEMYSDKKLGYIYENGNSTFRIFVPRGTKVNLVIFDKYDDETGKTIEMKNDGNQVFEYSQAGELWGKFYGYQVMERKYSPSNFIPNMPQDTIFADPYGKINASNNVFPAKYRTLIYDDSKFDWQNTKTPGIDINDTIILETHIRDLTAHPSAKSKNPGTYKGLVDAEVGGINYIKKLGVNVVEFLPLHDFANTEPPYKVASHGIRNVWNTYSQNYWGYMTNSFFSPETYYGSEGSLKADKWNGTDGRAIDELKTAVRELHKNKIGVILDVVYNHISQYDVNSLKLIDYDYYFKKTEKTGCGNEVETRRKMVRRMVLDSLKYWMTSYNIDGFRFDLATSHDKDTVQAIYDELKKINPKVYIIAEPWGGEGASTKNDFKKIGWSYWNDNIRGTIRGENRPTKEGKSFMLGTGNNAAQLSAPWEGTAQGQAYQSVGYIESHDDATLGDIIRILSGFYNIKNADGSINRIKDINKYLKLNPELLNASKVGATALFLAQGPIMLHLGQEWARSKITPDLKKYGIKELDNKGQLGSSSDNVVSFTPTPNSYSADNETNWINYDNIQLNQDLFNYYQGLIKLRKSESLIGNAKPDQIKILNNDNKNSLGVIIDNKILGFVNSDKTNKAKYNIPEGTYKVVVDKNKAGTETIREISGGEISVEEASALILIKK